MTRVAVVHRNAGRNSHGRSAFRGVGGAEQVVGQRRRAGTVAGQSQRVGQAGGQPGGAGIDRGPVKPGGSRRLAAHLGGLAGQDAGQPVVAQPVFG